MRGRVLKLGPLLHFGSSVLLTAAAQAVATRAAAQDYVFRPRIQWEARTDALLNSPPGIQLGVGANIPGGYYLRYGLTVAAGPAWRGDATLRSGRAELSARFLLDPFREISWGLYAGAGLTLRWEERSGSHEYLLVLAGLEGPEKGGWRTAVEAGLGGGARLGIVLRRARRNGR